MRIAFVGSEAFAALPFTLSEAGHELTHLFGPATSIATHVTGAMAEESSGVRWEHTSVTREKIEGIHRSGADLILCAGYPHRLDVRPGDPIPALNYHPSPLPEGRGPSPIAWAILSGRESTAVTFHEMVERFDAGPIVLQRELKIGPGETTPSLDSRTRQLGVEMVLELVANFDELWLNREPQGEGTFCPLPRREDRTLDLAGPVAQIDRVLRAFTPGNVFVSVAGKAWVVFDAVCWPERHDFPGGSEISRNGGRRLLAASDGYVLLRSALPERVARLRFAAGHLKRFVR